MADRRLIVPEITHPGRRLGRHVNHDPRSLAFAICPRTVEPRTVRWTRRIPVLNQGDLGSCVANAGVGVLGTDPFWSLLPADLQRTLSDARTAEEYAVGVYRAITARDPFPGAWEPDDTGSDGLTLAKELTDRGLVSGYQHVTSLAAAHVAIQAGPFPVGTVWTSAMFTPDSSGLVTDAGTEQGGHEYVCDEYDAATDRWGFTNSWSTGWGIAGRFYMSSQTFANLLARQGDATPLVPITAPAPTPVGPVSPVSPEPEWDPLATFPFEAMTAWSNGERSWWTKRARTAAQAYRGWLAGRPA